MALSDRGRAGGGSGLQMGGKAAMSGAALGAAIAGPAAPLGAAIGGGLGLIAGGITGWVQGAREFDRMEKLKKEQADLADKSRKEEQAMKRHHSAEVDKSRRRGEAFDYEPGDEVMMASLGGGSTYDTFMAQQYGG